MPLTDIKIKALKAGVKSDRTLTTKLYKVADEKGLYLEVTPTGFIRWRLKYRFDGKEKLLSVGIDLSPRTLITKKIALSSMKEDEVRAHMMV